MKVPGFAALAAAGLALAACERNTTTVVTDSTMRTGTPEAEAACVAAVNLNTADNSAVVLSSEFSEAGSLVMIRANDGATYRCLASNDGQVEDLAVSG